MSTSRSDLERDARAVLESELALARETLAERGIEAGPVSLETSEDGASTEARVYLYRKGEISDALEFFVWLNGQSNVDLERLRAWCRSEIAGAT